MVKQTKSADKCLFVNFNFEFSVFPINFFHTVPNFPGKMVSFWVSDFMWWLAVGLII